MMFPFLKTALSNLFKKPSTVLFPVVNVEAKPHYRGRITFDTARCRNCGMCMKVCSSEAITKTEKRLAGGKYVTYNFDMTSCTFCAMCEDFCSEKAIHLVEDYHLYATDPQDLIVTESYFKPINGKLVHDDDCVYCGLCMNLCPSNAITVDRNAKTWSVEELRCVECGLCVARCAKESLSFEDPAEEGILLGEGCVYCGLCAKKCPVNAITVDRATKSWIVDREACLQCGACLEGCPKNALHIGPLDSCALHAHENLEEAPAAPAPAPAAANEGVLLGEGCVFCGLCAKKCPVNAITVDRSTKSWTIDRDTCVQCGACVEGCPKKSLHTGPIEN